jgi:hypothetical protein
MRNGKMTAISKTGKAKALAAFFKAPADLFI